MIPIARTETIEPIDCLIVGGGPAGLTAAIYCARFLLTTVVLDAGGGRASSIPRTHNHAGFPGGIPGRELIDRIAAQARENGAGIRRGRVTALRKQGDVFVAEHDAGRILARTILLATGITDRRPAMADELHDDALARGLIRYCPICDGFEVRDKTVAVIGTGAHGAREARFLRSYSRCVSLLAPEGPHKLPPDELAELRRLEVELIDGPACDYAMEHGHLALKAKGETLRFEAVYPALGATIHSELAIALGAAARDGGCLIVDDHARTSVSGLYAAGDVVLGLDQISGAMGQAALAATTIRNDLAQQMDRVR
jgi:thioredoxin reductase (NADPH)